MKLKNSFFGGDVISLDQFAPSDISYLLKLAQKYAKLVQAGKKIPQVLEGRIIALLFFEPSSRTFGSFASAVKRLGGGTIEVHGSSSTSEVKGESFPDTIKVFATYSDAIVMRHPMPGFSRRASEATDIPVINAGDGIGEHPTQTFLDLYTIYERFKKLSGLKILIVGDLLNGRTMHSLVKALAKYPKNTICLLSPKSLRLDPDFVSKLKKSLTVYEIDSYDDIPADCDIWYWTRIQKERFANMDEYERVKDDFLLTPELVEKKAGTKTIFMHPLPRTNEIDERVDSDPRAKYFEQVRNGLYVRMALMDVVLNKKR